MTIAIFSNFINHHQVPLADELYRLLDGNFYFVETTQLPTFMISGGYPDYSSRPYMVKVWENEENQHQALELALSVDVAIFGADSLVYEIMRARQGKLSFEVSERWLKRGVLNLLSPRLIMNMWYYHTLFRNKPIYKLCCSAYAAGDQYKMLSYRDKCFKWGYFTVVDDFNIEKALESKNFSEIRLMWCARFLKLKHPELPIKLAASLKAKGYKFILNMYGSGSELSHMQTLVHILGVDDVVKFCGNLPNAQLLQIMRQHDIFLFTSDRNEGWGAVANEAMGNGCVLVGSDAVGSVPFLLEDGENGCIFKSGSLESLIEKVEYLINNPNVMREIAIRGYYTIKDIWSPKNAARNLLKLIDDLQNKRETSITVGPCSKALPI